MPLETPYCPSPELTEALALCESAIRDGSGAGVSLFLNALTQEIAKHQSEDHSRGAQKFIRSTPVFELLLQDPYTNRAFTKPRGFAGDAGLIDLFYGHRSGREGSTAAGRFLFEELMRLPSCDAVRYRRSYYANFIDDIATRAAARVLSIACGHLREALFSKAVANGTVGLVGIDSDELAIENAETTLSQKGVDLRVASVIDFIRRKAWGEKFDGIYAAGLFDYLDDRIAKRLLASAYDALHPGGVISVANFLPSILERGYMDLVMDWRLIYREPHDMIGLTDELGPSEVSTEIDPMRSIVYMRILKA